MVYLAVECEWLERKKILKPSGYCVTQHLWIFLHYINVFLIILVVFIIMLVGLVFTLSMPDPFDVLVFIIMWTCTSFIETDQWIYENIILTECRASWWNLLEQLRYRIVYWAKNQLKNQLKLWNIEWKTSLRNLFETIEKNAYFYFYIESLSINIQNKDDVMFWCFMCSSLAETTYAVPQGNPSRYWRVTRDDGFFRYLLIRCSNVSCRGWLNCNATTKRCQQTMLSVCG